MAAWITRYVSCCHRNIREGFKKPIHRDQLIHGMEKKKPPSEIQITGTFPKGEIYFRLDALAVQHTYNERVCLERDPSDDRVHMIIEGSLNLENNVFTVLSCGKGYQIVDAKLFYETDKLDEVGADITRNLSDQIKVILKFSGMALHRS